MTSQPIPHHVEIHRTDNMNENVNQLMMYIVRIEANSNDKAHATCQ